MADLAADDGSYISWNRGSFPDTSDDLINTNYNFAALIPANAKRIVAIERKAQGGTGTAMDPSVWHSQLTYDASTKTGTDPAPAFSGAVESAERTIGDTVSYLYGATPTVAQVRSTNFGFIDWMTNSDASHNHRFDYLKCRITYEEADPVSETRITQTDTEDMDIRKILEAGGLRYISDESITNLTASVGLTVPALTRVAMITVRGATVSIRGSGTASPTNGNDYEVGTHWLPYSDLTSVRMIESGGTASVFVTYFKV